jgi:hypothetical protein
MRSVLSVFLILTIRTKKKQRETILNIPGSVHTVLLCKISMNIYTGLKMLLFLTAAMVAQSV